MNIVNEIFEGMEVDDINEWAAKIIW